MNKLKLKKIGLAVFMSMLFLSSVVACATGAGNQETNSMDKFQSLAGTAWWVEDIGGLGVVDMSHTSIEFADDESVVGNTGCNRYFGSVDIDGSNMTFGPMAGTRMACAESLMDQEMKFYQAMGEVSSWEVAATGLLHLRDSNGKNLIRASATTQKQGG